MHDFAFIRFYPVSAQVIFPNLRNHSKLMFGPVFKWNFLNPMPYSFESRGQNRDQIGFKRFF